MINLLNYEFENQMRSKNIIFITDSEEYNLLVFINIIIIITTTIHKAPRRILRDVYVLNVNYGFPVNFLYPRQTTRYIYRTYNLALF